MALLEKNITNRYRSSLSQNNMYKISRQLCLLVLFLGSIVENRVIERRSTDQSIKAYLTERVCWWNEVCKEEFRGQFRCKCPEWSFCRSPGRYYNAYCSMTTTGYIWSQPGWREAQN